jgi:hypothetical protein
MFLNKMVNTIASIAGAAALTLSTLASAGPPTLHNSPVDGMDCTPMTVLGTRGTSARKITVRKLTPEQLAQANAEYKELTQEQRIARDKAFIAARAKLMAALEKQAVNITSYSCINPNALVPRDFIPNTPLNFTPAPYTSILPPLGLIPSIPEDQTNPCITFHDLLKDRNGKYIDGRVNNAWRDAPGLAQMCELPKPTTPVIIPPAATPPFLTPPVITPPGAIDCRDYIYLPPDRKPKICQPSNAVPEPGTLALLAVGMAGLGARRSMRKAA